MHQENQTAYAVKNYPDFFASLNPPKYMVKKSDGSFDLYDDVELAELKKANRIRVEQHHIWKPLIYKAPHVYNSIQISDLFASSS